MGGMARFYEDIATQAGLDVCEESTMDRVAFAIIKAELDGAVALIDIYDTAIDILIDENHPEYRIAAEEVPA